MKIRITKASGAQVELSDVAGVEIVEGHLIRIARYDTFGPPEREFTFEPSGASNGIGIYDKSIKWPSPQGAIG